MRCPCCSNKKYEACCGPYLSGEKIPPSPTALMRSRFTAYAKNNMHYIKNTMRGKPLENFDPETQRRKNRANKWIKLEVLTASTPENNTATVAFTAQYLFKNQLHTLHEKSLFKQENGHWYYVDCID